MIKKIWQDNFETLVKEGTGVISKEDIEGAVDMVIADRIDPQVFVSNIVTLLKNGQKSIRETFTGQKDDIVKHTSKTISYFLGFGYNARAFPLWFYAAYPDVMKWFHEWQKEFLQINKFDYDKLILETMKLFSINIEGNTTQLDNIINSEGKHRPEYLKNLVKSYKEKTNKSLEVRVDEFSESDIYTGQKMLKAMEIENNFTLIAENTTKYYLELSRNYDYRFNDKSSLLATAGILDAQVYIFIEQKINPVEILNIAKRSLEIEKNHL